ncbi:MAG TPA: GDSL-type esterase/lipase family protein [Anaeromyxobacter sp.]|nr:GDSL-type esterase/lipase family protein [Anaeromyxobacter sp.]
MTRSGLRSGWLLGGALGAALAAAVAVRLARGPDGAAGGAPPRAPARARAARPPPDRWGGPLLPAPIVSRGRRVASRPRGGEVLVDGAYRTKAAWSGGHPSAAKPSRAAIEVGEGLDRILVSWTSSGNHDYRDRKYGAPADYTLETSADSTNGEDGTWRTAVTVKDNPVRTRAHAVDFAGRRWVRMSVTRLAPEVFEWGLYLDEIDVHDLSGGGDDVWVFLGDSITSEVFDRAPPHQPSFPEAIAARHPGYFPAVVGAGTGSLRHGDAARTVDEVLALNPDARVVALCFGSNDWDPAAFRRDLVEVIGKVRAAGRIPVVPRTPFRSDSAIDFAERLAAVVDQVNAELGLLPGPDLHAWFKAHPERLHDGLHPDEAGAKEMIRLWADAVAPLYPPPPLRGAGPPSPPLRGAGAPPGSPGGARPEAPPVGAAAPAR